MRTENYNEDWNTFAKSFKNEIFFSKISKLIQTLLKTLTVKSFSSYGKHTVFEM